MTQNISVNKNVYVKTANGTYYQGMKRSEAERNNSYKRKSGIDFNDLDKNKDGVLSAEEISQGQRSQGKRDVAGTALVTTGAGMVVAGTGMDATVLGAPAGFLVQAAGCLVQGAGYLFGTLW